MSKEKKTSVLMICAHEPTMDPRIAWEASSAADDFAVTVLGLQPDQGRRPGSQQNDVYTVIRRDKRPVAGLIRLSMHLAGLLPRSLRYAIGLLALAGFPLVVVAEIAYRLSKYLIRAAMRGLHSLFTIRILTAALMRMNRLGNTAATVERARLVRWVLSSHFSTVTETFWDELEAWPNKPDVIHCNDLDTLLVGVLAKSAWGCRVVYDAHEFYPCSDPSGNWVDALVYGTYEKFLIRKVDHAITVNPLLAEIIRKKYGIQEVISVPNAEPWMERASRYHAPTEMARLANGRVRFLFQGRFTPERGIDELLDAWRYVDSTKAALFLRGPDNGWRQGWIKYAKDTGMLGRGVYFLDSVTEDMLVAAASEADVGIIPYKPKIINDRFACPNKLSQYLHAGLMVITSDLPFVKQVVTDADAGLFYDSSDRKSIVAAFDKATEDETLRERCRANALRAAKEKFNWQVFYARLKNAYQETPQSVDDRSLMKR